jgi:ribokinase
VRVAVVGHVEWIEFARVERVPTPGDIVHVQELWEEPGGGGAVAAGQLARLADGCDFYTALGDDQLGHRAADALTALGVTLHVAWRDEPQRRGFVYVDAEGERTITVIGDRLGPVGSDPLPWGGLADTDAVYFTSGDAAAVRRARAARTLVSTTRGIDVLAEAGTQLDALVSSSRDSGEFYAPGTLAPEPRLLLRTAGAGGGRWEAENGSSGEWQATAPPAPTADFYGCGDSFAAGLTYGLGAGMAPDEAIELGARCGAACATGKGPYAGQLRDPAG